MVQKRMSFKFDKFTVMHLDPEIVTVCEKILLVIYEESDLEVTNTLDLQPKKHCMSAFKKCQHHALFHCEGLSV